MRFQRGRTAVLLFAGTFSLYTLTAGGSLTSTDTVVTFDLIASIVHRHSIALSANLLGSRETVASMDGTVPSTVRKRQEQRRPGPHKMCG